MSKRRLRPWADNSEKAQDDRTETRSLVEYIAHICYTIQYYEVTMNIYTTLLLSFALTACAAEDEPIEENNPSSCPPAYDFSIDEDIMVHYLRDAMLDQSFEDVDCLDLCAMAISFLDAALIKEEGTCSYNLDFETLPDDFDEMDRDMAIGSIQCDGIARLPCD